MKLEAFADRGRGDFAASHDLEDMIAIVDGIASITDDVRACDDDLRRYLAEQLCALLDDERFLAALPGHLPGDSASQSRLSLLLDRLREVAERR